MRNMLAVMVGGAALLLAGHAAPAHAARMKCTMTFRMSGWSAFYKAANGSGTIHCADGRSMRVHLRARGGGLTVGKSTIDHGRGEFTGVSSINDLLGSYISAEAHAGAGKSGGARIMTKGEVSLALGGKGRGWDLGIAFGKLRISR